MQKSDLKDGMIVENRKGVFYLVRRNLKGELEFTGKMEWDRLGYYKNNLKHECIPGLDIIRVYKSYGQTFNSIFHNSNLELIWEREEEIDWSKVPKWTPVQVDDGFGLLINAYYFEYSNDKPYCHGYTTRDKFCFETDSVVDYCTKGKCKIHPSVEVKEDWYR